MMKKFVLQCFMAGTAAFAIAFLVIAISLSAASYAETTRPHALVAVVWRAEAAKVSPRKPVLVQKTTCVPQPLSGAAVGGLGGLDVPRLPGAVRTNYDGNGSSEYVVQADSNQVLSYYLASLASGCWELTVLQPQEATWKRGSQTLRVAVAEDPYVGKSAVDYEVSGEVRGVFYHMAQTSCADGQVSCSDGTGGFSCMAPPCPALQNTNPPPGGFTPPPGGGGTIVCSGGQILCGDASSPSQWCQMPPCPTPGGSPQGPNCTADQYLCLSSNTCIPNSSPCSDSAGMNRCGSGYGWCQTKMGCVPVNSMSTDCPMTGGSNPSPCPSNQYSCNGTCILFSQPCGSGTPTSGGYPQPPACPSGQYSCNGACIPTNQPCGGGVYPPTTGTGTGTPTTGGLTKDPQCGQNGYRDPNGSCFEVGAGKFPILGTGGSILICGDKMCEDTKGESSNNCPNDCGAPAGGPTSGGQYPGQMPGGNQGQPGQYPGGYQGGQGMMPPNQGGYGQGQGMGPGMGPGQGMQMGPSEEEMKMMLEQMKQSIKPMTQGVKMMKKGMTLAEKQLKKCSMPLPDGVKEAVTAMEELVPKIKAAESADEVFDLMSTAQEAGDVMQSAGQEIPMRIEFCMKYQQVSNTRTGVMKKLTQKFTTVNKKAQRSKNETVLALAKQAEEKVATAKGLMDQLPGLLSADFDQAQTVLDDFFSATEDAYNAISMVEAVMSAKSSMNTLNTEVRRLNTTLNSYEKKGEDVSAARALLTQIKEEIAVVLQDLKDKVAAEQLTSDIETVYTTREDLRDAVAEITGLNEQETTVNVNEKQYQMDVPDAFRSQQPLEGGPAGNPTCNVNGVEMPGTCDQYNQGGGMGMGPGPMAPTMPNAPVQPSGGMGF
ncbi:MAG: hypothetical protein PHI63_04150 [Patescibacteria group bacterium]|nr:hypothetical protein [Patescibacteria group bacterium]